MMQKHTRGHFWSTRILVAATALLFGAFVGYAGTLSPSLTNFEEAGFVVDASVNDTDPIGNFVNITNINNCFQAWRVGNSAPTTEDEGIVDLSPDPHGKVWRLSQGTAMGSLGAAPHSPNNGNVTPVTSGETGAANDAGCGAPTTSNFYGELQFKSVTGATQAGLAISVQASSADRRHGFVRILDDGAGFDLVFFDTDAAGGFVGTAIDTNLSYTDWHTLGIEIFFMDGLGTGGAGNDVVNIYIDGVLVHTGTSWETVYSPPQSVDRLMIAASDSGSGPVIPGQLGDGLYFDNVLVTDVCPVGNCNLPPAYTSVGDCISTLIDEECSGLTGKERTQCNHDQQAYCFDLFGVK